METVLSKFKGYACYRDAFKTKSTCGGGDSTCGGGDGEDSADTLPLGDDIKTEAWRDLSRQLGVHRSAVSCFDAEPGSTNRSLQRTMTEDGADDEDERAKEIKAERQETWKSAGNARKSTPS